MRNIFNGNTMSILVNFLEESNTITTTVNITNNTIVQQKITK